MYRHIIKRETMDKKLNERLDHLDACLWDSFKMIPMADIMEMEPNELTEMQIRLGQTKQAINDMIDWMVDEHEMLNAIDTKLDGLESMLKDIDEKIK